MKKRIITWTFSYEIDDTKDNGFKVDELYKLFQTEIEHKFPDSKQLIAYIHKKGESK